jgi:biopolymer transport protein ExbD
MTNQDFDLALRKKTGVKRIKKMNLVIDMTPMVDLGFLLIAFFILTTQMSQPAVAKLYMPHDGAVTKVPESRSLTILIGDKSNLFFYFGTEEEAIRERKIFQTGYTENAIGNIIRKKKFSLSLAKDSMIVLIKASKNSVYKNLVDILDEMIINNVKRYSIVDISKQEESFIETLR